MTRYDKYLIAHQRELYLVNVTVIACRIIRQSARGPTALMVLKGRWRPWEAAPCFALGRYRGIVGSDAWQATHNA